MPLPRAFGDSLFAGNIRQRPEDFEVEEILGFAPDGEGEHLFLWVEKRETNTQWLARQLARAANVRPVDVGYCGLKDRNAVARQWFSVRTGSDFDPAVLASDRVSVLDVTRGRRKLRRGAHRGNRFRVVVRELETMAPVALLASRVTRMREAGVPNYFGEQRFGRDRGNLELARQLFAGRRLKREQRSIALSAARAELFNAILAARVIDGSWNRVLPGDVVNLSGSNSVFGVDDVTTDIVERSAALDIHPAGSLWGRLGKLVPAKEAAALEQLCVEQHAAELAEGLLAARVERAYRALRVVPERLVAARRGNSLTLSFSLPSGSYATAVLHALGSARVAPNQGLS